MKILFWSEAFWPYIGGVETLTIRLVPELIKRGCEIIVITGHRGMDLPDYEEHMGIPIHRFHFDRACNGQNIFDIIEIKQKIKKIKADFQPDLTHINMLGTGTFFYLETEKFNKTPLLVSLHGCLFDVHKNDIIIKVINAANFFNSCSQAVHREFLECFPEKKDICSVTYNGMDAPEDEITPLNFEQPKILCLGRFVKDKGFDIAVQSWKVVLEKYPQAKLIFVGDGLEKENLEQLAVELGIQQNIDFVGWVSPKKIPEILNSVCMVIVPSRWEEPFCLVALEAALMERPVIASKVGGLQEVVEDNVTGLLVENENIAMFAKKTLYLLDNSDIAIQMGKQAKKHAQQKFSWKQCVDSYYDLYSKLIGKNNE